MPNILKNNWDSLWQRLAARGNPGEVFEQLRASYSIPFRAYHNLDHIADCFEQLRPARHLARNLEAVELAIWFHDAIYDTKAKDNEERSAAMAAGMMAEARLPAELTLTVSELILATKHSSLPVDPDSQLMVDVDLSILGRSPAEFDRYERQIREEYAWVASERFDAGRSAILKAFLDRPNIFCTEFFRRKYESTARQNLARSIHTLRGS